MYMIRPCIPGNHTHDIDVASAIHQDGNTKMKIFHGWSQFVKVISVLLLNGILLFALPKIKSACSCSVSTESSQDMEIPDACNQM